MNTEDTMPLVGDYYMDDASPLVSFYRGEIGNDEGYMFEEMMNWDYDKIESCHSHIQWFFPMREKSMFNPDAPALNDEEIELFKADPELRTKVKEAFVKILDFYGFELDEAGEKPQINLQEAGVNHNDPQWWLRRFNHNFLRISRILTSLRYLGFEEYSQLFFSKLLQYREFYDDTTYQHWRLAATGPLLAD